MNLDLIISAGYNTPAKLAEFCTLDNEEQDRIYAAIAEKFGQVTWICLTRQKEKTA